MTDNDISGRVVKDDFLYSGSIANLGHDLTDGTRMNTEALSSLCIFYVCRLTLACLADRDSTDEQPKSSKGKQDKI